METHAHLFQKIWDAHVNYGVLSFRSHSASLSSKCYIQIAIVTHLLYLLYFICFSLSWYSPKGHFCSNILNLNFEFEHFCSNNCSLWFSLTTHTQVLMEWTPNNTCKWAKKIGKNDWKISTGVLVLQDPWPHLGIYFRTGSIYSAKYGGMPYSSYIITL